ncbi:MAG: ABC transporter permease [Candidatus Jacksonbacteria bacterium]|nr:ABC transporter permease [Candidatus Jacksonbacteria bacterium]
MHNIITIFKKELRAYFNSPIAYIFLIVYLTVSNWLFFGRFFMEGQAVLRPFFALLPWIFLIMIPSLTMRLWADEKRSGGIELLMTLPLKDYEAVLGKFVSALAMLGITLVLTLPTAFTVIALGDVDGGEVVGGYLGALLLGGTIIAFGAFMSSLTRNQIVAFLLTIVFSFILLIIGADYTLAPFSGFFASVLNFASFLPHYEALTTGLIDGGDVVYFLGCIFLFLFLNTKVLESRQYRG